MVKCPICNKKLSKIDRQYVCENKHSYDLNKHGYLNLLVGSSTKIHGDEKEMLLSRTQFLETGYYQPLANKLSEIIRRLSIDTLLDMGCGEGYYTQYIREHTDAKVIGMDISKEGVLATQKRNKQAFNVVGSNADVPFMNHSFDGVLSIFAPYYVKEIQRVLKPGGYFIKVYPLQNHLLQLKETIYEEVFLNPEEKSIQEFTKINHIEVSYEIDLKSRDDIYNLFTMTPYFHRTKQSDKDKLLKLANLTTQVSFGIDVYKNEMNSITYYELGSIPSSRIEFAIIISKYKDKYVMVKHKKRNTLEIPGGNVEKDEGILECAKRELFEETGAVKYTIEPRFIFEKNGLFAQVFEANIEEIVTLPDSEIEKVVFLDSLDNIDWTYPDIQPYIIDYNNNVE